MKMPIGEAAVTAVLGYAVVFFGLALLMAVLIIMGRIMISRAKAAPAVRQSAPAASPAPKPSLPVAPGSAGEVKLHSVPDKDAAMIMAIVADKLHKPLNELRFKSIKEVK